MSSGPSKLCEKCGDVCMTDEECIMRQLRAEVATVKAENERLVDACFKWEAEVAALQESSRRGAAEMSKMADEVAALKAKLAEKDDVIGATGRAQQSLFNECERLRAMYEGPLTEDEAAMVFVPRMTTFHTKNEHVRDWDAAIRKVRRERGRP